MPSERIVLEQRRRRQEGKAHRERTDRIDDLRTVREGGHRFLVNLGDPLDTGLSLHHRQTRAAIKKLSPGRRFLNLFCHTGTATVYAAAGEATSTTSVDLSPAYLDWAGRNLRANGLGGPQHDFVEADVLTWLETPRCPYDLVFLDPTSSERSGRKSRSGSVERDHVVLIERTMTHLAPGGILLFGFYRKGFRLDEAALAGYTVRDLSRQTLPPDFERQARMHHLYRIEAR